MGVSASTGPLVTYGADGPNMIWGGSGMLDPRRGYQNGQDVTVPVLGWTGQRLLVLDQVPSALAANNIAASQTPTANQPLTLVAVTGAGITAGASVVNIATGALATNLLAIDGAEGVIAFKALQPLQAYDPRTMLGRAVRLVSVGNDSTATFTVRGYSIYGEPMSEVLTGAAVGTATGKKAFGYIASITPAGTLSGSAVTVGTTDIVGLPLRVDEWPLMSLYYGAPSAGPALISAMTGFVAPDVTSPATGTTGDTRGTYALQTASDGTNKIVMFITVPPWRLAPDASGAYSGIFGVTNYAA